MSLQSIEQVRAGQKKARAAAEERLRKNRRPSPKFIRDPIHDIIKIEDQVVLDVLDTAPMQRLRRIRQLGNASLVFPGAEHSRFAHSLGTYHLSRRMLDQLKESNSATANIEYYDRVVIQLAALLHDVGHGPYSHLFEQLLKQAGYDTKKEADHEWWSKRIIAEDDGIEKALRPYGDILRTDVKSVIAQTFYKPYLQSIVSSQFDVDRFDYMRRDSHMTGVTYGNVDLNWILRNLSVRQSGQPQDDEDYEQYKIVINIKRGISSLEAYLLGNLYLYKNVYWHKTIYSADTMLQLIFGRALELVQEGKTVGLADSFFTAVAKRQPINLDLYASLDDRLVDGWLRFWAQEKGDAILKDLSRRLVRRQLYKPFVMENLRDDTSSDKILGAARRAIQSAGKDERYYMYHGATKREAYDEFDKEQIYFIYSDADKEPKPLGRLDAVENPISTLIGKLAKYKLTALMVAPEFADEVSRVYEQETRR